MSVGARQKKSALCASWAIVLVASVLSSCSLVVEPDVESIGSPPRTCMPAARAECACLGGVVGVQRCNDEGYFDPCMCGTAGSGS